MNHYCIDYGCEAAWAGYYDGIDAIPGALIKYACVDACYHQLCACTSWCNVDYPLSLKKHSALYNLIRAVMPLVIKRCLSILIDGFLHDINSDDEQINQMQDNHDIFGLC
jgi:hypothetical protein